jgi:hypothetical protein
MQALPQHGRKGVNRFTKKATGVPSLGFCLQHADTRDFHLIGAVKLQKELEDGQPARKDSTGLVAEFGDTPSKSQ